MKGRARFVRHNLRGACCIRPSSNFRITRGITMRVSRFRFVMPAGAAAIALCMAAIAPAGAWDCSQLPSHYALRIALTAAQAQSNGGFGLEMWGAMVDRDGTV